MPSTAFNPTTQAALHQQFAQLHSTAGQLLLLPNAWDAASAKLFEASGAQAIATSSASLAWARGYADGSALPHSELISAVAGMTRVLGLPLTVDMEDGYSSDPLEVGRLAVALTEAGAVGINIEDGSDEPALLVEKIRAIRAALKSHDGKGTPLYINARTDIYLRQLKVDGTPAQASIARLKLYQAAGADGAFVPGLSAVKDIEEISQGMPLPLNVMLMPGLPTVAAMRAAGARRISSGPAPFKVAYLQAQKSVEALLAEDLGPLTGPGVDYSAMNRLLTPKA